MIFTQIFLAWLYSHVFEYLTHRYVLHGRGKLMKIFKHHFSHHHKVSRKNEMYDSDYLNLWKINFENSSLFLAAIIHLPVVFFFPYAYFTLVGCIFSYYLVHRKAHVDVEWGKKWLPWHYEHHMGKNQHVNWGVRLPIFDYVFKTRVKSS